jgi:hypothetical protein
MSDGSISLLRFIIVVLVVIIIIEVVIQIVVNIVVNIDGVFINVGILAFFDVFQADRIFVLGQFDVIVMAATSFVVSIPSA